MAKLDAEIEVALKKHGLGMDAVWAHKQSGKYIMYHWACEHIAIKERVQWEPPFIVAADPANKTAVICVTGKLGDRTEWSFGEAAPYNTTQTYPFAMAEKRAKDRVVLKLIGLHGKVYSEEEADDFKPNDKPKRQPLSGPLNRAQLADKLREIERELKSCTDIDQFDSCLRSYGEVTEQAAKDIPDVWFGPVEEGMAWKDAFDAIRKGLEEAKQAVANGKALILHWPDGKTRAFAKPTAYLEALSAALVVDRGVFGLTENRETLDMLEEGYRKKGGSVYDAFKREKQKIENLAAGEPVTVAG